MGVLDFTAYELHRLKEAEGYYDDDGIYHDAEDKWICMGKCNAQQSGGYRVIGLPDGSTETYSFTIIVHNPHCREFKYGERIKLTTMRGREEVPLTVKGFSRHYNFCKIYA